MTELPPVAAMEQHATHSASKAAPLVADMEGLKVCLPKFKGQMLWDAAVTDPEGAFCVWLAQHKRPYAADRDSKEYHEALANFEENASWYRSLYSNELAGLPQKAGLNDLADLPRSRWPRGGTLVDDAATQRAAPKPVTLEEMSKFKPVLPLPHLHKDIILAGHRPVSQSGSSEYWDEVLAVQEALMGQWQLAAEKIPISRLTPLLAIFAAYLEHKKLEPDATATVKEEDMDRLAQRQKEEKTELRMRYLIDWARPR